MNKGTSIRNKLTEDKEWRWNSFLSVLLQATGRIWGFRMRKMDSHWRMMSGWLLVTFVENRLQEEEHRSGCRETSYHNNSGNKW